MKRYEWVPLESLEQATGLSESEVNYRLSRLIRWGMVRFNAVPYDGYALVFGGYDTLALTTLARKGIISALGTKIGEGKESVVYDALGLGPVAVKFHRIGQRSFNTPRVDREYIPENRHCPWLLASRLSAEREYAALCLLHPKVSVPLPVGQNRNAVVMALIDGSGLARYRFTDPSATLDEILANVRAAYGQARSTRTFRSSTFSSRMENVSLSTGRSGWRPATPMRSPFSNVISAISLPSLSGSAKLSYDPGEALRCVTG